MRTPTAASILVLASVSSAFAALTITAPPAVNQCQDATFSIGGNNGNPVYLSIVPSVDPCEHDALLELGPFPVTDGTYTWQGVNITSGTSVYVVADSNGEEAWSEVITIGGSGSDCPSSSDNAAARTTAVVNNVNTATAARATNTNVPVNAGSNTDTPENTSGAISIRGSPQIGAAALLGAVVAFFV